MTARTGILVEQEGQLALLRLVGKVERLLGDRPLFWLARLLAHLKIEGDQHIPATGPCILASNHVAPVADLVVILAIRHRRPDFAIFGWQALCGENPGVMQWNAFGAPDVEERLFMAYKARGLSAGELLRARQHLSTGGALIIHPEGEQTWDGRLLHPLVPGAAWLGLQTGAPVVPVVSIGGHDLQPRWQLQRIYWTGRLTVLFGPAFHLSPEPVPFPTASQVNEAGERLSQALARLLPPASRPDRTPSDGS